MNYTPAESTLEQTFKRNRFKGKHKVSADGKRKLQNLLFMHQSFPRKKVFSDKLQQHMNAPWALLPVPTSPLKSSQLKGPLNSMANWAN